MTWGPFWVPGIGSLDQHLFPSHLFPHELHKMVRNSPSCPVSVAWWWGTALTHEPGGPGLIPRQGTCPARGVITVLNSQGSGESSGQWSAYNPGVLSSVWWS